MKIVDVGKSDVFFGGGRVVINEFRSEDYFSFLVLLKHLGLKRNRSEEKRLYDLALRGYKKLLLNKDLNESEFSNEMTKYESDLRSSSTRNFVFKGKVHSFLFNYSKEKQVLVGSFRSKEFSCEEFFSLILSNK